MRPSRRRNRAREDDWLLLPGVGLHMRLVALFLPVALITILVSPAGVASNLAVSFEDAFESASLDGTWRFESDGHGAAYALADGVLAIEAPAGTTARLLKPEPPASYSYETQLAGADLGEDGSAGLTVYRDADNWLAAVRRDGRVEFSGVIHGNPTGVIGVAASEFDWLRLRKAKDNPAGHYYSYYFDTSADGVNWTNVNVYADRFGSLHGTDTRTGLVVSGAGASARSAFAFYREYPDDVMASVLLAYPYAPATEKIVQLTGPDSSLNGAMSARANVCGTDLGIPFRWQNATYLAFGDTLGCETGAKYRPNALAATYDSVYDDGLALDTWVTGHGAHAKVLVARRTGHTVIPTGAVAVGDDAYLYYMEVASWDQPEGAWTCDYTSVISANASDIAEWRNHYPEVYWERGDFNQLAVLRDDSTTPATLYIYATPCGRFGSTKLMRVPETAILDKQAYRYFAGFAAPGVPAWSADEDDAIAVAGGPAGELSLQYNEAVGRYLMTYLDEGKKSLVVRESAAPWGPWSAPIVIARSYEFPHLYGAFLADGVPAEAGPVIYYTMSQWEEYNVFWMRTHLLLREP